MSKTITLRINDHIYQIMKTAADEQRRTLSNFIEFAILQYLSSATYVNDEEMELILSDTELRSNLQQGLEDVKRGNYTIHPRQF